MRKPYLETRTRRRGQSAGKSVVCFYFLNANTNCETIAEIGMLQQRRLHYFLIDRKLQIEPQRFVPC